MVTSSMVNTLPPAGIRRFGILILRFTIFIVLFVPVANLSLHRPRLASVMFAVALAVGLKPELLALLVTVTLARSTLRLSKRRAIIKPLSAIHDLGGTDMLCTDKTGTLTQATIKLVRTVDGHGTDSARTYKAA